MGGRSPPPAGTSLLASHADWQQQRSREQLVSLGWMVGAIVVGGGVSLVLPGSLATAPLVLSAFALLVLFRQWLRRRTALAAVAASIAVEPGHPWSTADADGSGAVHLLLAGGWTELPAEGRLRALPMPMLGGQEVRLDDRDETRIGVWEDGSHPDARAMQLAELANMALSLRDAQARVLEEDDPFEAAREREDVAEGLLERSWDAPEPGSLAPQRHLFGKRPEDDETDESER